MAKELKMFYDICVNYKKTRPHCDYFVSYVEFCNDKKSAIELAKQIKIPCKVVARDYTPACYGGVPSKVIWKNF